MTPVPRLLNVFLLVVLALVCAGLVGPKLASAQESNQETELETDGATPDTSSELLEIDRICGTRQMNIARMRWPSAEILSNIHDMVLRGAFDCDTRLVIGSTSTTGSAMATTQSPAIAPELWVSRIPEIWNTATKSSSVVTAGSTFGPGAMQGWYVPKYVTDENPTLKTLADLANHWQLFRRKGEEQGTLVSCPQEWACAIINRNMVKGLGLEETLKIATPENGFGLNREITSAISKHEPILFYYWQPSATLAQFEFTQLDAGNFNAEGYACNANPECATPSPTGYGRESVIVALSSWVQRSAPEVANYFSLASMPLDIMNKLLVWQSEFGADPSEVARHFLKNYPTVWSGWMTLSQKEKLQTALASGLLDRDTQSKQ